MLRRRLNMDDADGGGGLNFPVKKTHPALDSERRATDSSLTKARHVICRRDLARQVM